MLLGCIRFYMADRTGRNKRIQHDKLKCLTWLAIVLHCLYVSGMLLSGLVAEIHVSPLANICSHQSEDLTIPGIINSSIIVMSSMTSIYYDVKLVKFVRHHNQVTSDYRKI